MKMRRGRYHFTATKDTPPGVRWRKAMDVQGLLMEAARRLDEETEVARVLPSQAVTFVQGDVPPPPEALTPAGRRIIKLALGGRPLGRIIRLAQTDSFTTRELLKGFIEEGWLAVVIPDEDHDDAEQNADPGERRRRLGDLRKPIVTLSLALLLVGFGGFRWAPLMLGEMALIGLAAPAPEAGATGDEAVDISWLDEHQQANRQLRLRQIKAEIGEAARQYRTAHGGYPAALDLLVEDGLLTPDTWQTVSRLGWQYAQLEDGRAYKLSL
jgi:hypothetical protein